MTLEQPKIRKETEAVNADTATDKPVRTVNVLEFMREHPKATLVGAAAASAAMAAGGVTWNNNIINDQKSSTEAPVNSADTDKPASGVLVENPATDPTNPANTNIPSSPFETTPAAPGETFVGLSDAEMAKYEGMTPEQLGELDDSLRMRIFNTLAQGTDERQSLEEFSHDYYGLNTANTQPGKPSVAPPEQSLNSTPQDIVEHITQRIRYTTAFRNTPEAGDFTRAQVLALTLRAGVNSTAYKYWLGRFNEFPDNHAEGKAIALNKFMPLAGEIVSASDIKYYEQTGQPYREITQMVNGEPDTSQLVYIEYTVKTASGDTVTKGDWVRN